MSTRLTASLVLATAVLGLGAYAVFRTEHTSLPNLDPPLRAIEARMTPRTSGPPSLPPGHPVVGANGSSHGVRVPQATESQDITWTVPSAWTQGASPSAMRIATYRVPHAPADTEDADVSVTRAGGTTDANIERWSSQFDDRGLDTRTEKDVHGLRVTIVEMNGTYLGSGMTSGAPARRAGWMLLGAIVEGAGTHYFFKATGPEATVRSARASFVALVDSLTPA